MMFNLENMNSNQLRAVKWQSTPLLVLAGPGSGKTYVLTMRIARIISETPDDRFRMLGLTFTTKAADEMRDRVTDALGAPSVRARLATFHSFAADVLRQHGSYFGLRPDFRVLARDVERFELLGEAIKASGARQILPPTATGKSISLVVDRLFLEGYDGGDEVPDRLGTLKKWVRPVYNAYLELLAKGNYLDFGALLIYCLRLFRERPRLASHFRNVYPYVCVDEYQDTNAVQDQILRTIYPNRDANVFVVADDDQTIYEWNGANARRIAALKEYYGMKTIQLPESYRCPPQVVSLANNLIEHNTSRAPDRAPLVSATDPSASEVVVRRFRDENEEATWIAENIVERHLRPKECTVLARSAKLLHVAGRALSAAKLTPYLPQRKQEFESSSLRFIHSALRLCDKPADASQLAGLCAAFGELTAEELSPEDVIAEAAMRGESLLKTFAAAASEASKLSAAIRDHLLDRLGYRDFVDDVLASRRDASGLKKDKLEEDEIGIWNELCRNVWLSQDVDIPLSQFLQELDLRPKVSPPGDEDIQCLTIHMAKGKEFKHVYVMGLVDEQLPSYYAVRDGGRAMEEERRNCFVAVTRAWGTLTMTYARTYFGYSKEPSRFLSEMRVPTRQ